MNSIKIRKATTLDATELSRTHYAALSLYHDFYGLFFSTHPSNLVPQANLLALSDPQNCFLVAAQASQYGPEKILGFIRWRIIPDSQERGAGGDGRSGIIDKGEQHPEASMPPLSPLASLYAPKDHMRELWDEFCHPREDEMDLCYETAVNGVKHMYIKHLMVHPDHQRKGIGAMLLESAIRTGAEAGIPIFLVASAEALELYTRFSFLRLGTWIIENGKWVARIVAHENDLGMAANTDLISQYSGVSEVECYMVRWPEAQR